MCNCNKDQTPKESKEVLAKSRNGYLRERGTGIFLIPAPELGVLAYRAVNVQNLTYFECVRRGHHCLAFKWVSVKHADIKAIEASQLRDCFGFCNYAGGFCPIGCICGPGNYCSGMGPEPSPTPPWPPDPTPWPPDPDPDPPKATKVNRTR